MRKLTFLLLSAVLVCRLLIPVSSLAEECAVSARHAILYEPVTGAVLFEKDAHSPAPMASTTKIMTALVALKHGNLEDVLVIPREACGIEGSSVYLEEGERLTLGELLYALLLQSANDAATAIALHVGGSIDGFAALMNEEADSLGLEHTHFTNPHGLDDPLHYTTAYDLARITAAAMEYPLFCDMVKTVKHTIPHATSDGVRLLVNHNKLLRMYDGATGVKTGFTKKCGRCLVGAAERDGLTFITVTLNAPSDWSDHTRMLDLGFSLMENRLLAAVGEVRYALPVLGKETTRFCVNCEPIYAILPKDAPAPSMTLDLPHYLTPNQKKGASVGEVHFTYQGKVVASAPLLIDKNTP